MACHIDGSRCTCSAESAAFTPSAGFGEDERVQTVEHAIRDIIWLTQFEWFCSEVTVVRFFNIR